MISLPETNPEIQNRRRDNMGYRRQCGVLLPVSSLPSKYGVGTFGQAARDWVDFLSRAKQRYWQVLPLGPTSFGDSPYQSYSAFAGNPLLIDLGELCQEGLLKKGRCKRAFWGESASYVDYDAVRAGRERLLRKAFEEGDWLPRDILMREKAAFSDAVGHSMVDA